jgi:two-component SAPR family response regulator
VRNINRKQNMQNANQLIENLYIKNKQQLNEDYDYEPKPIGKEGIEKKIAELVRKRNSLEEQRKQITKEIKFLNDEIKKWQTEISPNQLTMFGDI